MPGLSGQGDPSQRNSRHDAVGGGRGGPRPESLTGVPFSAGVPPPHRGPGSGTAARRHCRGQRSPHVGPFDLPHACRTSGDLTRGAGLRCDHFSTQEEASR